MALSAWLADLAPGRKGGAPGQSYSLAFSLAYALAGSITGTPGGHAGTCAEPPLSSAPGVDYGQSIAGALRPAQRWTL